MRNLFGFFILVFAGFWVYFASRDLTWEFRATDPTTWVATLMCVLFVVGVGGVLASALSALGPLQLPSHYEWPAGYVRRVVTSADGKYIVPLWPSGRIQVYDSQWRFVCGWNVDAWGGYFIVQCSPSGVIEVFTLRDDRHYSFTQEGHLISSERFSLPMLPPQKGRSAVVPTPPLLWIFSSPILSGALALIGFVGLMALNKIGH
ncbi:MAG: hypothetical protein WCA13_06850 [Terriglobales bacterium]